MDHNNYLERRWKETAGQRDGRVEKSKKRKMKETEKKEVNKKPMVQVKVKVQGEVKVKAAMVQVRWMNMGKSMQRGCG